MVSGVHTANPLRGCFLASVSPLRLEKITTIMSPHSSPIRRDGDRTGHWSPPRSGGPWPAWHAITERVASRHRRPGDFVIVSDGEEPSTAHGTAGLAPHIRALLPIGGLARKGCEAGERRRTLGRRSLSISGWSPIERATGRVRLCPLTVHNEQSSCRDIVSRWAW